MVGNRIIFQNKLSFSIDSIRVNLLGCIILLDILTIGLGSILLVSVRLCFYLLTFLLIPWKHFRINAVGITLLFLAAYVFLLSVLNTSNYIVSLNSAIKINLSFWVFIYAFIVVRNEAKFLMISKYCYIALILAVLIVILANLLKFGEINYRDSSILFGASGVNIVKNMTLYGLMSIPYLLNSQRLKSWMTLIVLGSFFLIIMLATKRSAILAIGLYIIVYIVLHSKDIKRLLVPGVIIFLVISYAFGSVISDRISNRAGRFDLNNPDALEQEWRLVETLIVIDNYNSGDVATKVFGLESFNESEAQNLPYMYHNDFAVLLGSMGLLGLGMYAVLQFNLIRGYLISRKQKSSVPLWNWLYLVLFLSLIVYAISGNFKTLGGTLGTIMIGFGACHGVIMNRKES